MENLPLDEILNQHQPWPIQEVLKKLIEASKILLDKKGYDGHGWEEIHIAVQRGEELIKLFQPEY